MSVIQSSIPDEETLYAVLPRTKYEHSTAFERRAILSRPPKEAGLVAPTNTGKGVVYNFVFDRSTNCLLSLQETCFSVTGYLKVAQVTTDTSTTTVSRDMLKCSQQWMLSLINNCSLKLGSKEVERRTIPILLNDYNFMMKGCHRDIEAGCCEQQQFFYNDSKYIVGTALADLNHPRKHGPMINATIGDFEMTNLAGGTASILIPFSCYLPLNALFSIDSYKPIFNTEITVTLQMESSDDVSISLTTYDKVTIDHYNKFQCDFVQYTMNENFQKLVGKVYAKPQIVVVDSTNYVLQTLQNQQPNTQVQLSTPINILFDLKDMHIAFPKSTGNLINSSFVVNPLAVTNITTLYNEKWANSALHSYMPIPLSNIKVQVDTYDLLERNFQIEDVTIHARATGQYDKNINIGVAYSNTGNDFTSNYYTYLYNNYLICRRYHDELDDGVPHSRFLFDKFMISMPCYQFSRISSGSAINVNLTFPNYNVNPFKVCGKDGAAIIDSTASFDITQMLLIQHASRAIAFNAGNVDIKEISVSFSNEIELE